ncbi:LHFPL tetraspan subfamily member 2a protein-like [Diadema antillarum]|uniref:LHFPL tetraspan subfamily member 2a protein-like n=1 Tax=Diadema antillarum TaxID=105358 RepID=UPI003A8963E6
MCYVIITIRSLFWTLLSIAIVLGHLVALMTSYWLLGEEEMLLGSSNLYSTDNSTLPVDVLEPSDTYTPTLGIFVRCSQIFRAAEPDASEPVLNPVECTSYINSFMDIPSGFWRALAVFYGAGFFVLVVVALLSVFSLCFQSLCKKSLFTVCGAIQAMAGLLIIISLVLFPAGWGAERVQNLCGTDAAPFELGTCSLGWSFYVAVGATVGTFVTAVLSVQAEIATSSDDIQDEISQGKYIICLP